MVNFLALLGWSPGDDRELMSIDELVAASRSRGSAAAMRCSITEKLDWMNGQYIARLPIEALAAATRGPLFAEAGFGASPLVAASEPFSRLLDLLRPRAKRLTDFVELARPLLVDTVEYEPEAVDETSCIPRSGRPHRGARGALRDDRHRSMSHMWKRRCVERQRSEASRRACSSTPRASR